jgi:hypothetical protein
MHSDVLSLLDDHLTELQALRRDLTLARPIRPGARWDTAAATLRSAQRYASELTHILTDDPAGNTLLAAEAATNDEAGAPPPPAAHRS